MGEPSTNLEHVMQELNDNLEALEKQIVNRKRNLKREEPIGLDEDYHIDPMEF